MKNYVRLLQFVKPYIWPHFALAMACMLIHSATSGALPFITKKIFDDVFASKNQTALTYLPLLIIGVFALRGFTSFVESYLMSYIGVRVMTDIRNVLYGHIQTLSLSFFQRNPTGHLITRITHQVGSIGNALTGVVVSLLRDSTTLIALTVAAFVMDPLLAVIAIMVFPLSVFPLLKVSKKIRKVVKKGEVGLGGLVCLMQETIQGARIVKAFGMEQYERDRFQQETGKLFKLAMKVSRIKSAVGPGMELLAAFAIGGVVWYGGYGVVAGNRTQGQFMAFLTSMFLLYKPFKNLSNTNAGMVQASIAADAICAIIDTKSDIQEKPDARPAPRFSKEIRFHDVSFSYGRKPVLKDINLKVGAGETVALVGVSGVGKSTLADLIPRFYDVTAGKITLDGIDLRDVTIDSLRSQIGIVTQHTFLFNDTIRNNIAYGDHSKDMEQIVAAAKAAHAHDFIIAMPQGYDTMVGEMGMKLSGGERQRLAIARALLKDPPILILDEATSSLDSESERFVQDALDRLMAQRTTLVIAHRLSTIRRANRIVVLVNGAIVETGTHDELLELRTEYHKLYTLQLLEGKEPKRESLLH
jgi:subfamily B ATP-binding cassette protein MsbA